MKFEYEKPNLEELELILEGSFLDDTTIPKNPEIGKDDEDFNGEFDN
ncbi:MAG: hypothetical protein K2N28_07330 [Muribaculaceae bacterium]|nr:hypothetical protein [Muribaculaceae bacterium]